MYVLYDAAKSVGPMVLHGSGLSPSLSLVVTFILVERLVAVSRMRMYKVRTF